MPGAFDQRDSWQITAPACAGVRLRPVQRALARYRAEVMGGEAVRFVFLGDSVARMAAIDLVNDWNPQLGIFQIQAKSKCDKRKVRAAQRVGRAWQ